MVICRAFANAWQHNQIESRQCNLTIHNRELQIMSNKNVRRRDVIVGAATVAGAAVLPSSVVAQDESAAAEAFFQGQKYTYCDAKILANFWSSSIWEAKVGGGQMILERKSRQLNEKLRFAANQWSQAGFSCSFEDVDNPPYSYDDAVALAEYWGGGMTPYDAKLKIVLNAEGGGNSWVLSELAKAKSG
jgi:hypothetical protein